MAGLLSSIVLIFLCCHSTKIVVNFYEAIQVSQELGTWKLNAPEDWIWCTYCFAIKSQLIYKDINIINFQVFLW